jgi:phage shock protein A
VLQLEAQSQAIAELSSNTLEQRFASLESGDVDDELAAMKAQLSGSAPASLPASDEDEELKRLRSQLEDV